MSSLERIDIEERALALLEKRARYFAKVPGLKKEITGNPDAIVGISLSLQGYGLPVTLSNLNNAFDWIQGRAAESSLLYQQLARLHGYDILPMVREPDLAVALLRAPDGAEKEIRFTIDDAIRSHRLDAWVERQAPVLDVEGNPRRYKDGNPIQTTETFVVRVNGQPLTWQGDTTAALPDPLPDWVQAKLDAGEVKVYTAWWDYRVDMMWKAAAKRAVKVGCPHVLLGGNDFEHSAPATVSPSSPVRGSTGASEQDPPEVIDADSWEEPPGERVPNSVYDESPEARGMRTAGRRDDPGRPF